MGFYDDDSSYSDNNIDDDDDDDVEKEKYEDDSYNNNSDDRGHRSNSGEDDSNDRKRLKSTVTNKKRPRNMDGQPRNDDVEGNRVNNGRIVPLKPDELYVDWGDVLHSSVNTESWWVHQPLVNHNLPLIEIDKLIGYATHITTYHHPCTTATATASATTATTTNANMGRTFHNPLLGLPSVPIRPTLLKHLILDPATKLTSAYMKQHSRYQNVGLEDDTDSDDDDMMHDTNPRPKKQSKKKKTKTSDQSLLYYERFHHSAAMAIGMFIEEMITATLLPLAQQYVQYCRRHHQQQHPENHDERLWTLPPEEAIMKLYDDLNTIRGSISNIHVEDSLLSSSSSSSLLSTRIPTRSCVSGAMGTSILNQPSISDHTRIAYNNWCRTTMTFNSTNSTNNNTKMQQQWIENDVSFFQLLIQNIPSRTTMNTTDILAIPTSQRPIATSINPILIDDIVTTDHTDNEI